MKHILITGVNSYVGNNLNTWLQHYPDDYEIDLISLRDDKWKEKDFSTYDVIVHVAGIAHVSTDPKMEKLYYQVNRDLTVDVAKKSKADGVKQFIFLSSIIVYGDSLIENGFITEQTKPIPSNFYGNSKLEAEMGIQPLETKNFKIVIVRPPMIYGKDSKGNYPRLARLAQKSPIFPNYPNKRSMIHIDNLSEFLRLMIDNNESGLFFPQNKEYVQTSEMVKTIAEVHGKRMKMTKLFNPLIKLFVNRIETVNKVFGDLAYQKQLSEYEGDYCIKTLKESIEATER